MTRKRDSDTLVASVQSFSPLIKWSAQWQQRNKRFLVQCFLTGIVLLLLTAHLGLQTQRVHAASDPSGPETNWNDINEILEVDNQDLLFEGSDLSLSPSDDETLYSLNTTPAVTEQDECPVPRPANQLPPGVAARGIVSLQPKQFDGTMIFMYYGIDLSTLQFKEGIANLTLQNSGNYFLRSIDLCLGKTKVATTQCGLLQCYTVRVTVSLPTDKGCYVLQPYSSIGFKKLEHRGQQIEAVDTGNRYVVQGYSMNFSVNEQGQVTQGCGKNVDPATGKVRGAQ